MSTTHHHRSNASDARQRAHQRDLLHLLANRDLLVRTIRDAPLTDDEDAVGYLHLLAAVEAEIEEHFPDIYARELPHWLLAEAGMATETALPRCRLCREARRRRSTARA
ncbi:hypothetical protein [Actinotalea sp. K2]|uniref:hypothetical protein n=1 Tax=Actinotalea sp. K2 TaxID=2939438 RepID=UPI002016EE79|nr:hypothetical protein [Actinotalea sp. K2]MCL3861740.1 hypothetical protein [Actinotalea sp. K2]